MEDHKQEPRTRLGRPRKHGMTGSPTYRVWGHMLAVCRNENNPHYATTGGRGIGFDPKWETFEGFLEDMGVRPPGARLRRNSLDQGFSLSNCYWQTPERSTKTDMNPDTKRETTQ